MAEDDTIDDATSERDYESEARAVGWKPEAEFKGKPGRWKPAEDFIRAREEQMPVLQSLLAEKDKVYEDRLARMERASAAALEASQRASAATIAELQNQVRHYFSNGDIANFAAASSRLEEAKANVVQAPAAVEDVEAIFKAANPWYGDDDDLTEAAQEFSQARRALHPQEANEVNLRETAKKVKRMFPDKFKPREQRQSAVDGGSVFPNAGNRRTGKGYNSLPSDAKAAADRFVKQGLFKTGDEYAAVYFDELSKERRA